MGKQSAWRVIMTKPQQETKAMENLVRQGYEVYLPMLHIRRKTKGTTSLSEIPLFPRYLFIHLTSGIDDWGPIRSTLGVSKLVNFGLNPAKVPDELISNIKSREAEDGFHHEQIKEFQHNDKVRVISGPLSGYDAIFQAKHSDERVMILLDIIGKSTCIEIASDDITLID